MWSCRSLLLILLVVLLPVRAVVAQHDLSCATAGRAPIAMSPGQDADVQHRRPAAGPDARPPAGMPCHVQADGQDDGQDDGHAAAPPGGTAASDHGAPCHDADAPCHDAGTAGGHAACSLCGSCCTAVSAVSLDVMPPALPALGTARFPGIDAARPGRTVHALERPPRA